VEAGTSANVNKGSNCIWYGTYINYDNLGCIEHPLRDICRAEKDGDNFVMRMKDITPLDYAKYKQANDTLKDTLNHKFLALGFSAFALVISLIALFNKVS
jgi:hypothetical protein